MPEGEVLDLYTVRKAVRHEVSMKKMFMEDVAWRILALYPTAKEVRVSLAFNRHVVIIKP